MFDTMAWFIVRLLGLMQFYVCSIILEYYHPNPSRRDEYEHFQTLHSGVFGGMFLFQARTPDDVPAAMRESLLSMGRIILAIEAIMDISLAFRKVFLG